MRAPEAAVVCPEGVESLAGQFRGQVGEVSAVMEVEAVETPEPAMVALVIDGSAGMADAGVDWGAFVDALPDSSRVNAYFAYGGVEPWRDDYEAPSAELVNWLSGLGYAGGCNSVPALERALTSLAGHGNPVLIWIHAPLPEDLGVPDALEQWERRRPGAIRFLDVAVKSGPNCLMEKHGGRLGLERVPVVGSLNDTLGYVARHLRAGDVERSFALGEAGEGVEVSGHLVRLAVAKDVWKAAESSRQAERDRFAEMASAVRVITPLSGAVVLERQEQYERHGLDPERHYEAVPSVPEPEEWALSIVAVLVVLVMFHQRRKRAMGAF